MSEIFIGRQPIFDRDLEVYAYELLFRANSGNIADIIDGDEATSDVIVNTFMEIGLDTIVGHSLAFINLTRSYLVNENTISLPKDRVVLEILEDIEADEEVINGVKRLASQGYTIALDDFIYKPSLAPLIELAQIVKIDIMQLSREEISEHIDTLRPYKVKLLAEKVETQDEFDFCMNLGFDYFQGYFLSQPKVIQGQRLPNNRLPTLRLLGKLQEPDISAAEVEELISQDVSLSYKILRYANSAAISLPRKVDSIHEAFVILGLNLIMTWTTLLAISKLDNKPDELMVTALMRGKMAEELARTCGEKDPGSFFTVGLFSTLDALMDNTMEEILTQLPLADNITEALLNHTGIHGQILECVLAYERGQWDLIKCSSLNSQDIRNCFLEAITWSREIRRHMIE